MEKNINWNKKYISTFATLKAKFYRNYIGFNRTFNISFIAPVFLRWHKQFTAFFSNVENVAKGVKWFEVINTRVVM